MTQDTLPNRRSAITESILWMGNTIHLRAGLDSTGAIKELWIKGGKSGSEFDALCDEFAIMISRFLQSGMTVEMVRRMFGRLDGGAPASIAGAAADWLQGLEAELSA